MEPEYVAIRFDPDGPVVLGGGVPREAARELVVQDRLRLPWEEPHEKISHGDREYAVRAYVALDGLPERKSVYGQEYQILPLPEGVAFRDWWADWGPPRHLMSIICARDGQYRVEIFPNEGQHRGRPHCKVTYGRSLSASFTLPEGVPLHPGQLRKHEPEARKLVAREGDRLLRIWEASRPDDQRLH